MKKITEWIVDIISLLLFITCTIISALDLFGVVDIAKIILPADSVNLKVLNILVVMVGSIGVILISQRMLFLKTLEKNISVTVAQSEPKSFRSAQNSNFDKRIY